MKVKFLRTSLAILVVFLVALPIFNLAGCGEKKAGTEVGTQPGGQTGTMENVPEGIEGVKQKANEAVREANLRMIDSAVQMYYASNETWPTSISQLVPQYLPQAPVDPGGGTYYIIMQGGQAKAACR